jgi:methyltransferase (TIGR00027 family)
MGRALAHGTTRVTRFSDPTALALLPDGARARVERVRAGKVNGVRERLVRAWLVRQSAVMIARTVTIDDAVRAAAHPQLVILGAGLDGRAWRMPELRDSVVFEVDHPDSQREKRERIAGLTPCAREVRFVPVDFTRDALEAALAAAGHDSSRPTTWIWEGVIMYLTQAEVDATLAVLGRHSARGSRLVAVYHSQALMRRIIGLVAGYLGEPFRSAFEPDAMRALLGAHGFEVTSDQDLAAIGAALGADTTARIAKHLRIVVAERGASSGP